MEKEAVTKKDKVAPQLSLIDTINEMINMAKAGNDELGIRQYEHLKKQYIENLFKMLEENYQIPIPTMGKKAA
ncbi:MAG: hypothetical protein AB8G86_03950 [Saprospiraceae bacterium]